MSSSVGASTMKTFRLPTDVDERLRALATRRGDTQTGVIVSLIDRAAKPRTLKRRPPDERPIASLPLDGGAPVNAAIVAGLLDLISERVADLEGEDPSSALALVEQLESVCNAWVDSRKTKQHTPKGDNKP